MRSPAYPIRPPAYPMRPPAPGRQVRLSCPPVLADLLEAVRDKPRVEQPCPVRTPDELDLSERPILDDVSSRVGLAGIGAGVGALPSHPSRPRPGEVDPALATTSAQAGDAEEHARSGGGDPRHSHNERPPRRP